MRAILMDRRRFRDPKTGEIVAQKVDITEFQIPDEILEKLEEILKGDTETKN